MTKARAAIVGLLLLVGALCAWMFTHGPARWPYSGRVTTAEPRQLSGFRRRLLDQGERLRYECRLNGVPVAVLEVVTGASTARAGALLVEYELRPTEALGALLELELSGDSLVDAKTLLPSLSHERKRTASREKRITTRFDQKAGLATVEEWRSDRPEPKTKKVPTGSGLDAASAFLYMRAAAVPQGQARSLTVLSGDKLYEVALRLRGAERIEVPAGTFDAMLFDADVRRAAGETSAGEEAKSLHAQLWLSRQGRMPLRLEARVALGHVEARLLEVGSPAAAAREQRGDEPDER